MTLRALPSRDEVHKRLQLIFPDGTAHRRKATAQVSANTIFCALYLGAVDSSTTTFQPKHVYRMTDEQSALTDEASRLQYLKDIPRPGFIAPGHRWYSDNSREQIRDDTIREALIPLGAVVEKTDVATTAGKPRYALSAGFAGLFDPALTGVKFEAAISAWQTMALSAGALAKIAIVRKGATADSNAVIVTLPNGGTHRLKAGPSSVITKAVIEEFAPRFLKTPAVLFVSESGNKVVARHDDIAKSIGLNIKADKNLPDSILADVGLPHPLLVFVEVVATDGPINDRRKEALQKVVTDGGFPLEHVAFLTAYLDRSQSPFSKNVDSLAWGSYAWFASEPDGLIELSKGKGKL